jgi:hypothetical protein
VPWYLPLSRFDRALLQAPPPSAPVAGRLRPGPPKTNTVSLQATQQAAWDRLHHWCHDDAGPARTAWWQPWALPAVAQRLKVAVWAGDEAQALRLQLDDFCRDIDGSDRLQALPSRWAGRAWRLQIKLSECAWWRGAQDALPWDAGYLIASDAALARLAVFRPRRATLIVAKDLSADQLASAIQTLKAQCHRYAHALRFLVLNSH